jgi:NADPH-dependent curcumin reductase CurA
MGSSNLNRSIVLASRPVGFPSEENFRLEEGPIPQAGPGEFVVEVNYLSVDPYMRGRMSDAKSYAAPVQIGEVMTGGAVGRVIESQHPKFAVGDFVQGMFGWQEYAKSTGGMARKVDPALAPISTSLGVLGMPGLTAYFGLLDICDPKPGETVVVSGAAGAVGSYVGQIANLKGCRTVGIAGSDDKVRHLIDDLHYGKAYNYKTVDDHYAKLRELCPDGIDGYFDNVGGAITDAVLRLMNVHARVAICGQISQYNNAKPEMGPRLLGMLIIARAKVQGFLVSDYAPRFGPALQELAQWVREGKLVYREQFEDGIENAPKAFLGMLAGKNTGKQLVRVRPE